MDKTEYLKLHKFENEHWWFKGKRELLGSILQKICKDNPNPKILDVGSGTGSITNSFQVFGDVIGIEPSRNAINLARSSGINFLLHGSAEKLKFEDESIDIIFYLDVLEHLEDENITLSEAYRVLKKDGFLIVTVPAYMSLWSDHDLKQMHYRRYSLKSLNKIIKRNKFSVEYVSFWNFIMMPAIFFIRKINNFLSLFYLRESSDVFRLPKLINNFLLTIIRYENKLLSERSKLPFGVSILSICRKTL